MRLQLSHRSTSAVERADPRRFRRESVVDVIKSRILMITTRETRRGSQPPVTTDLALLALKQDRGLHVEGDQSVPPNLVEQTSSQSGAAALPRSPQATTEPPQTSVRAAATGHRSSSSSSRRSSRKTAGSRRYAMMQWRRSGLRRTRLTSQACAGTVNR